MRDLRVYLDDLMREIELVARFTVDGKDAFMADERNQYAVMMAYARIGEIAKRIPNDVLATQPHIEWAAIKGFRDVLIHRYFDLAMVRVWEAVEKLSELRAAVEAMLAALPPEVDDEA
ncbi:MAG: DUF86 domain-containing protein [Armatimonadetes bacterium]|nr:DUF86 domain-containing protein [Anaerolineae bacterium]